MSTQRSPDDALRKLFLGGLHRQTTEDDLTQYFSEFGTVADCAVIKDEEKNSRGFGFVTMETIHETDLVLLSKTDEEQHNIGTKNVEVKRAVPRDKDMYKEPIKKLFIAGFKKSPLSEEDLRLYYETFCHVEGAVHPCSVQDVHIVKDKATGACKGYAFVTLSNRHMVDKAAIMENHEINNVTIVSKKAAPKEWEGNTGGRGGGRGRGGGGGRGRGASSGGYGGGGGYSGGYGGNDNGYSGGDSYSGGSRYGRGRGGRGGGTGGGSRYNSGGGGGGGGYDSWGGYEAESSGYGGSNSSFGPVKGYGGGGGSYSGSYDSYGSGGYGSGGRGRGSYRPY